jgi:serine/threonine protein kinase
MVKINQVIIKNEIGYGMAGTIYEAFHDDKKYALKIEKITKNNYDDKESKVWREINFAQSMSSKYPDQFMKLYDYEFDFNCKHVQKYNFPEEDFEDYSKKRLEALKNSRICIKKLYQFVDTTLEKIIDTLSIQQLYSFIIQITLIVHFMKQHNYAHGDLHSANIGVINTSDKYINIADMKIPTFGYIYKLIDYGAVKHIRYENSDDKYTDWYDSEIRSVIKLFYENSSYEYIKKNKIIFNFDNALNLFYKTKEYKIIKDIAPCASLIIKFILFEILFTNEYNNIILSNEKEKEKPVFQIQLKIPLIDIIYFVKYSSNLLKNAKYFYNKIV